MSAKWVLTRTFNIGMRLNCTKNTFRVLPHVEMVIIMEMIPRKLKWITVMNNTICVALVMLCFCSWFSIAVAAADAAAAVVRVVVVIFSVILMIRLIVLMILPFCKWFLSIVVVVIIAVVVVDVGVVVGIVIFFKITRYPNGQNTLYQFEWISFFFSICY